MSKKNRLGGRFFGVESKGRDICQTTGKSKTGGGNSTRRTTASAPHNARRYRGARRALDRWREGKEYPNSIRQAPQNATSEGTEKPVIFLEHSSNL